MSQVNDTSSRRDQEDPIGVAEYRRRQLSADLPRRKGRGVSLAVPGLLVLALALCSQSIQTSTTAGNSEEGTTINKDYSSQRANVPMERHGQRPQSATRTSSRPSRSGVLRAHRVQHTRLALFTRSGARGHTSSC